jgi:dipeptidyl aminopeptidase/acylaminoacyl peptidase
MTLRPFCVTVLLLTSASMAAETGKPKITLDEFFNYVDFSSVQISPDGNSVIVATDRADWDREIFQTDLWLYRSDGHCSGSLTQMTHSGMNPRRAGRPMGNGSRFSPNGSRLRERMPTTTKTRTLTTKTPLFEADWYQWDRLAASDGWLVFEPHYRGSIGYGDAFRQGLIPEIVSRPGKDILAGVDALVKDGIADPNRLTIGGYSYGGYMTNWLITETTRFKAAVTGAGAVEHTANWGNDDMTADDAYNLGGRPWEAAKRYIDVAAVYRLNKVRTPTHVVVGADDIRVAASEQYLLDRALHSLGIPSTLLVFPGEGHSLDKNPWHGKIKVREELKWLRIYGGIAGSSHASADAPR